LWGFRYTVLETPLYPGLIQPQKNILSLVLEKNPDFTQTFVNHLIDKGYAKINENFEILMDLTNQVMVSKEAKVIFCNAYGILHLAYAVNNVSNLNGERLKLLLKTTYNVINWLKDEDLDENQIVAQFSAIEHCAELKSRLSILNQDDPEVEKLVVQVLSYC